MNTVGDILKLRNAGHEILTRTGLIVTKVNGRFVQRMKELVIRSFSLLCVDEKDQANLTRDQLPPFGDMCDSLNEIDQSIDLPQFAQAAYYCAVAVLLTMDGHDEEMQKTQYSRADALMNSGILSH